MAPMSSLYSDFTVYDLYSLPLQSTFGQMLNSVRDPEQSSPP